MIAEKVYYLYMEQYGPDSEYEDGLKLRIADVDKRLANLLKDVEAGNSSDIIRDRMIELQKQKKLLEEELKRVNHFFYVIPQPLIRRHSTLTVA